MNIIKEMTGNDKMTVRSLYGKPASFSISGLLNIQVNNAMEMDETGDAITARTRWIEYPFLFKPDALYDPKNGRHKKMDTSLKGKFKDDPRYRDEFILLLLDRNKELGEKIWNIQPPKTIMEYTDTMFQENSELADWISEYLVRDENSQIESASLWRYYQNTEGKLRKREFFKQIRASGFYEVKNSKMYFKGMRKIDRNYYDDD